MGDLRESPAIAVIERLQETCPGRLPGHRFCRRRARRDRVGIRPRRFGKSLWVSLLENYYDRFWSGRFEATFAGTDVGRDPTGEQSRYVVLQLAIDFIAAGFPRILGAPEHDTDLREHVFDDKNAPTTGFLLDPIAQKPLGSFVSVVQVLHQIVPARVRLPRSWR